MRIAITGATGFIGLRLCAALAERGDELVVLSRDPDRARGRLPGVAEAVAWNPTEQAGGPKAPPLRGVHAVVNLAGESIGRRWNGAKKQAIRDTRVRGTRHLVAAMKEAGTLPGVWINASAVGYYGDRGEEELTEESSAGEDFLAEVCQAWEAEAQQAAEQGWRVVCLRSGIVLGPGGGALQQMLPSFRRGLGGPMGHGRQWMSWIHRDDLIGLLIDALDRDTWTGPVNAVAPEPIRNYDFARTLGRVLRRPAFLPAPRFALRLLLGEFADLGLLASQRVLPTKAQAAGFTFQYPDLEAALREILVMRDA
jgi:uncharacterized protein (TIGR01777 family)